MSKNTECVKVVIRCRPLSSDEIKDERKKIVKMDLAKGEISILNPKAEEDPKQFTFDLVYDETVPQEKIYKETAFPIVESVLEGYNGTIFAYGQTGTGKTYTMEGKDDPPSKKGIIPRTFDHIFTSINSAGSNRQFLVRVSFLELYNEEIRDLLNKNSKNKLEIREKPESGIYIKDLSNFMIQSSEEMKEKLEFGRENRSVGATAMNLDSSRSHSLFVITIENSELKDGESHIRSGKLNLVDLAGSERQTKTGATGDRFKEAININQSLTTLGNVISALVDNKTTHIPYRDSKLTRLLQDSLGGNTKTIMIANVGPADYNFDETVTTLRYANRAKSIKNKPKINEDPKDAILRQFQEEIEKLKSQLEQGVEGNTVVDPSDPEAKIIEVQKVVKVMDDKKLKNLEDKIQSEKQEIKKRIEMERKKIEQQKNIAEDEKIRLLKQLEEKEDTQQMARDQQQKLLKKIKKMEEKLLQGNSEVEEAEQKQQELEKAMKEIEEQKNMEKRLADELRIKEEEMMKIERQYKNQKEEVDDKTNRIKQMAPRIKKIEQENRELEETYSAEIEDLQERRRILQREYRLKYLILQYFIPDHILEKMQMLCQFKEATDEWVMIGNEHSGNILANERAKRDPTEEDIQKQLKEDQMNNLLNHPNLYYAYTEDGTIMREEDLAPTQKKAGQRGKSAKKPGSAKKRPGSKSSKKGEKKLDQSVLKEEVKKDLFPVAQGLLKKGK